MYLVPIKKITSTQITIHLNLPRKVITGEKTNNFEITVKVESSRDILLF